MASFQLPLWTKQVCKSFLKKHHRGPKSYSSEQDTWSSPSQPSSSHLQMLLAYFVFNECLIPHSLLHDSLRNSLVNTDLSWVLLNISHKRKKDDQDSCLHREADFFAFGGISKVCIVEEIQTSCRGLF